MIFQAPSLEQIRTNHAHLSTQVKRTPTLTWCSAMKDQLLGDLTEVVFKAELFQLTGTFKIRGALTRLNTLTEQEKAAGIVTASGGNHGIAVAYASRLMGIDAKIVVPKTMNSLRRILIDQHRAHVIETDHISEVMEKMNEIAVIENRIVINGFDHPDITLGQAGVGLELIEQAPHLDTVIVAVGGGGLASGVACAIKQVNPNVKVYGVEPEGASSMFQSFKARSPMALTVPANSIADSLCAPYAGKYSYAVCAKYLDDVVLVSDDQIRAAMHLLFEEMKVACEPACAASTAAILGPLKNEVKGKKTGVILCGSNIDIKSFYTLILS